MDTGDLRRGCAFQAELHPVSWDVVKLKEKANVTREVEEGTVLSHQVNLQETTVPWVGAAAFVLRLCPKLAVLGK